MGRLPKYWLAAAFAGVALGEAAKAEERVFASHGCELASGETGIIVAVTDLTTLQLDTGLVVSLAGIEALPADEARSAEAVAALAGRVVGQAAELRYGPVRRDRYGRATAQVMLGVEGEEQWLQASLLRPGHARVLGFADDRSCLAELLQFEREARMSGLGFWPEAMPFGDSNPSLRGADGLYALVEGRVESIGRTERTVYLNFGRDWSTDFTVTISAADARDFEVSGGPLDVLSGRRVRVRGWLTEWNGPWIEVDHPEQIEILD